MLADTRAAARGLSGRPGSAPAWPPPSPLPLPKQAWRLISADLYASKRPGEVNGRPLQFRRPPKPQLGRLLGVSASWRRRASGQPSSVGRRATLAAGRRLFLFARRPGVSSAGCLSELPKQWLVCVVQLVCVRPAASRESLGRVMSVINYLPAARRSLVESNGDMKEGQRKESPAAKFSSWPSAPPVRSLPRARRQTRRQTHKQTHNQSFRAA